MFKIIRRISSSVFARPDRPWEEDPTSNAPTRRKRRLSSTEPETSDEQEQGKKKKKIRGDVESKEDLGSDGLDIMEKDGGPATPEAYAENEGEVQREGSVEVKFVTKGVKEVELDDTPNTTEATTITVDSHPGTDIVAEDEDDDDDDDVEGQPDSAEPPATSATQEDAIVHPESIPLPEEDDESDELASSSPSSSNEDSVIPPNETTTADTPVEASHEPVTEESSNTTSPEKRPPTRASASPRKLPSQSPSPQKLFTTTV